MAETAVILGGVAIAASVAGTAVAVDSSQKQAKAARDAAQLELNQYAEEKKAAQDAANQQMAEVLRQQQAARSALVARRAAMGLDPYGPNGRVLLEQTDDDALADLESIRANSGRSINRLTSGELSSQLRSRNAITSANSAAWGAVAGGVGSIAGTGYRFLSKA